jgi:hypothetical protein
MAWLRAEQASTVGLSPAKAAKTIGASASSHRRRSLSVRAMPAPGVPGGEHEKLVAMMQQEHRVDGKPP